MIHEAIESEQGRIGEILPGLRPAVALCKMVSSLAGSFMRKPGVMVKIVLLAISILASSLAAAGQAPTGPNHALDEDDRRDAARGLTMMMDGDLEGAAQVFQQIEQKDPESPLGYVLEANATWWKIYYVSANLIDPDVFDVANMESTPYDSHFDDLDSVAIRKAEARIHRREDLARSYLYEGFAYALRARLEGLHDRDLPTARAGKRMRSHLLRALEIDPSLTDAYLGIGIYNYFVDTLPGIVKFLSLFIMLPGGSRTEGLRQLQLCAEKGELARPEAKFYLAKDFTRANEKQYEKSMRLFDQLQQEFPHNPLWPMLIGSLHYRLENPQKGEEIYRQVYEETIGKNSEVDKAVHHAASQALERQHPEQKFP
jgi:tetratricopeptide (TPR) repeat protein